MDQQKNPASLDHDSDPARTPGDGWVDEGGASHLGPATHIESGHGHPDSQDDDERDNERQ